MAWYWPVRYGLRWRLGRMRARFTLLGALALLLSGIFSGCATPQPFDSVPAQRCASQQQGALGAGGGIIVPLAANDPTSSDRTSALYAIRARDGGLAWSCASTTYAGWDDARLVNGVLYTLAGTAPTKDAPAPTHVHAIYAIRPQDGKQLWSYSFRAGSTSPLAFDGDMLFVTTSATDGASAHSNLYAIHTTTGVLAWEASYGDTLSAPIIVDHHIVTSVNATSGQELRAIDESSGKTVWSHPLSGNQPPVAWLVVNDALYISDGSALTRIDGASGSTRWTEQAFENLSSPLFSVPGAIIFSASQSILAFDTATGAMRWSAVLGAHPQLTAVVGQVAYAVTPGADGVADRIYALNVTTGDVIWQRGASGADIITPQESFGVYLTVSTGEQKPANVEALDQRGRLRWAYKGQSQYSGGALMPEGATLYYVWQELQPSIAENTPVATNVTALRASDGATLWTTPLPALNTYLLPPQLVAP